MKHHMRLWNDSFQAIKNGSKTIEMRLNDDKRKIIKDKDEIIFVNTKTNEQIICKVIKIHKYKDFIELYDHHDKVSIGYTEYDAADPKDMLAYYTEEEIRQYGCLGIEIELMR